MNASLNETLSALKEGRSIPMTTPHEERPITYKEARDKAYDIIATQYDTARSQGFTPVDKLPDWVSRQFNQPKNLPDRF